MSKWTKAQILKKTAGVKIHKSFREAIGSITQDLEKQHFEFFNKAKEAAKAKRKAAR